MESKFMTVKEVAEELNLSDRAINNYIKAGKIPVVEISPKVRRIKRKDFDKFIDERMIHGR